MLTSNLSKFVGNFVSPPARAEKAGHYTCVIEYRNKPHSLTWSGSAKQPDITNFPEGLDWEHKQLDLGWEISKIWSDSMLVGYGADASLRCSHSGPYPIIKLAHEGEEFRSRIQHEFEIIQDMHKTTWRLPIPKVDSHPLLDNQRIFGYRLEPLIHLERGELSRRLREVREAVHQLHQAGFSHGDLSESNMMKNKEGAIVLIDFGCAGKIGAQAPLSIPRWIYENAVITAGQDQQALERISESN